MQDKAKLCEKIRSMYPDIGSCGIDVDVALAHGAKDVIRKISIC